jgi:hypothetical protein
MACLIDATCAVSMSAEPDAARLRKCCDSPDRLTLASPEALAAAGVAVLALGALLAAGVASLCCERDRASFNVGRFELVVESTFTIGFLNDLILITATVDQNFSAIAPHRTWLFSAIWPHRHHFRPSRRHGLFLPEDAAGQPVHS